MTVNWSHSLGVCLFVMGSAGDSAVARGEPLHTKDGGFNGETVAGEARRLAQSPYSPPHAPLPKSLAGLDYDHYRDIRFRPEEAIWGKDGLGFRLQLLQRGWIFADPVEIALVDDGTAHPLAYRPELFTTGKVMTTPLPTDDVGYSGWRALYPINRGRVFDEVAAFQGASYFRSLGREQLYGLSARGLAIKTADPTGEEFPAFRAFWTERPSHGAHVLVAHALLDSPSTTGAFRFTIRPGTATMMDVEVVLFPRTKLENVGLGPATSMFMFSANGREHAVIADDLTDSFEQCPPSIIDLAVRARRWCQGNLQHTRVLGAKGLHWVSRLHLLNGIFSYVSSPLWLLFLVATLALGVQNEFAKPEYFTRSYTLFPLWPHLDPVRAMRLFGFTLAILFGPKALGFFWFVTSLKRLRGAGILLPISFAFEILLSALVAPILMLIDCGLIWDILCGKDAGWRSQRRADDRLPWSQALYRHRWHMVMGAVLIGASRFISWQMLAWLLPAVVGMVLAVPLSQWTGSAAIGRWFRRAGILRVPTEVDPPPVVKQAQANYPIYRDVAAAAPDLLAIAADRENLERHLALVDRAPYDDAIDPVQATASLKIERAGTRQDAVAVLTPEERARVQSVPELLSRIFALPDRGQVAHEE